MANVPEKSLGVYKRRCCSVDLASHLVKEAGLDFGGPGSLLAGGPLIYLKLLLGRQW